MMHPNKLTWSVSQNNDRIALQLAGELSRDTLLPLWNEWNGQQRFAILSAQQISKQHITWELAQLTRIDSAGFAFFCELLQDMQKIATSQSIDNTPTELRTLADLYHLDGWLNPFINS